MLLQCGWNFDDDDDSNFFSDIFCCLRVYGHGCRRRFIVCLCMCRRRRQSMFFHWWWWWWLLMKFIFSFINTHTLHMNILLVSTRTKKCVCVCARFISSSSPSSSTKVNDEHVWYIYRIADGSNHSDNTVICWFLIWLNHSFLVLPNFFMNPVPLYVDEFCRYVWALSI